MSTSSPLSENDLDFGPTLRGLRTGLRVFERYTLVRKLGQGGMGVVWLARDDRLQIEVALKFLPESVQSDPAAIDDLRRETRRCLGLTHPHIVRIFDLVEGEDAVAIAMEYVEGQNLTELRLTRPDRVFEVADLMHLLRQLCDALTYAHEKGQVIHRDLKPANILITCEGEVKVADFGVARSLGESRSRHSSAAAASGAGTLVYMSPQQLMGFPAAVGDDVYALGATLYDLLTSKPPFFSGSIERQIETIVPPAISARRVELRINSTTEIPAVWEETIAACLEKEAQKRPQSAEEIWQRLCGQPVGDGTKKKTFTTDTSPASSASRRPLISALAALLCVGGALGWWFGIETPKRAAVANVEQQRREKDLADAAEAALRLAQEKAALEEKQKLMSAQAEAARIAKEKADAEEKSRMAAEMARIAKEKADAEEKARQMAAEKERQIMAEQARLPKAGADFKSSSGMLLKWVAPLRAWVGATEVTQEEFVRVMGTNPSTIRGVSLPVNAVTWNEAQQFCHLLTSQDKTVFGQGFHFAYQLPGDSDYSVYVEGALLSDSITSVGGKRSRPATVASGAANAYGLYDVRGNVWEWLADRFDRSMNSSSTNARLASGLSSQGRVLRGGSFTTSDDTKLDINTRASDREDQRDETCGFRVILRPVN
jgi:serine/threonine protein kinase/formylglycine-generating enzyme required for sulfatase activity